MTRSEMAKHDQKYGKRSEVTKHRVNDPSAPGGSGVAAVPLQPSGGVTADPIDKWGNPVTSPSTSGGKVITSQQYAWDTYTPRSYTPSDQ